MLNAWQRIAGHTPGSKNEVENEIIWHNKFITIAGKSVFYQSWYEAGVKYILDLTTEDGNLMTLNVFQISQNFDFCTCPSINVKERHAVLL